MQTSGIFSGASALLRPGNAGSSTAADHITVLRDALPAPDHKPGSRPGRKVLVRVDGAGATHALLDWLTGQRLSYSVGFTLPGDTAELLTLIPDDVWQVALDSDGGVRDGAWLAELTGLLDLKGWPKDMRVIAAPTSRRQRPGTFLTPDCSRTGRRRPRRAEDRRT